MRKEGTAEQGLAAVRPRVLVVEDQDGLRTIIGETLSDEGFEVTSAASGEEGLRRLEAELFDVVLLDLNLPGMHGLNVLSAAPVTQTDARFVVMTAFGSVGTAVEAMKLGAFDYLSKPFKTEELVLTLNRAIEETELRREVAQLRARVSTDVRSRIVGHSPAIERVFDLIERVAPTRANVLIVGETGTGKELVARAIHDISDRSRKPFIPVNCSALTETLLESELFGHVRGAFTGAVQAKRGVFEAAKGGTLFLDELGTLAQPTQAKLLRVLQERKVTPVGSTEQVPVDFRLVAATNEDLSELVGERRFREDLYFRLNVFSIVVPPLRDRRADIPLLANHFRLRIATEYGIEPPPIRKESLSRMMEYAWPGNVRELENSIERSMILHGDARSLSVEAGAGASSASGGEEARLGRAIQERWDLERLEREHILAVLEETGWHHARASDILGISRRTLFRKLTKYRKEGLLPEDPKIAQH